MPTLQTLDYAAIFIYMFIVAGVGFALGFFVKNVGDYFKGGGTIPWYVGGISNFMTLFSTFVFVAYAGIAYEHGLVALVVIWCAVPATIIGATVFAHRWRRAGISSPVEFMETRFNPTVRQIFSWGGLGFRILDNMVRLYAIGVFVSTATPMNLETSILVAGVIVVFYTVVGGLWAVVLTDVIQFVVLIVATIILVPLSIEAAGGWANLVAERPNHFSFFNGPKGEWTFLLVYYLMFAIKNNGNWAFIQRFYSVKDEKAGRKMGLLTAALFLVFPFFFMMPPIAAALIHPNLENPEMAYVTMALNLLPAGIMGIMIAAMFAATMSSLDSEYNVMANVITSDIYKRLFKPHATEKELMSVARATTLIVGTLVTLGALFVDRFGGAFEASKLFTSLFAVPLIIPVLFGVLFPKANSSGAILSLAFGVATGLILNFIPSVSWQLATFTTILVGVLAFGASSIWTNRNTAQQNRVDAFFARLRTPIPLDEQSTISSDFKRALLLLFMFGLGAVGLLLLAMSLPSLSAYSGRLTMIAACCCLVITMVLYFYLPKRIVRTP